MGWIKKVKKCDHNFPSSYGVEPGSIWECDHCKTHFGYIGYGSWTDLSCED